MKDSILKRFNKRRSIYSTIIKYKTGDLDEDVSMKDLLWKFETLIKRFNQVNPSDLNPISDTSSDVSSNISSNISSNLSILNLETELDKILLESKAPHN